MAVMRKVQERTETAQQVEAPRSGDEGDQLLVAWEGSGEPTLELAEIQRGSRLVKWSQIILVVFALLEMGILFRMVLNLIIVNPASPFAQSMYHLTNPFFVPFATLTPTFPVTGSTLAVLALIAMIVLGVLSLLILRAPGVIFNPVKVCGAAKEHPDL